MVVVVVVVMVMVMTVLMPVTGSTRRRSPVNANLEWFWCSQWHGIESSRIAIEKEIMRKIGKIGGAWALASSWKTRTWVFKCASYTTNNIRL